MKRLLASTLAIPVLLGLAACAVPGTGPSASAVPPPPAPRPVVDVHWGERIEDPWRFLEETQDPAVAGWMKAQADATESTLARLPGRAALLARVQAIESRAAGLATDVVRADSGRLFFQRRDPGDDHFRLVYRDTPDGPDHLVFDPAVPSRATGTPHALMDFAPSPDGRLVAYSVQAGGSEIGVLHVVDLATGRPVMAPVDRIRYANVSWLEDGSGFFYSRLREGYDKLPREQSFGDRTVHFRRLADAGSDRAVFSASRAPALGLPAHATGYILQAPGTRRAVLIVFLGVERHRLVYVADLDEAIAGGARWSKVAGVEDRIADVDVAPGGDLYLRSAAGSPRYDVRRLPAGQTELARAEVVVPAAAGVITSIASTRDALYVVRREGAVQALWRRAHRGGALERVALPFDGGVEVSGRSMVRDELTLSLSGWTKATKPWIAEAGRVRALPLVAPGAFDDAPGIVAHEVHVKSHDGVEVPLSILARRDLKLDGSAPTLLYGYGAYGVTEDPGMNPRQIAWLERGGVLAIAHVRGGGAYGEEWHLAGRKATKPNTWKDTIAAAEWLVARGWTRPSRLALYGGSAGGILVGRAITDRPDLFAAAVPVVGTLDMLRSETSANGPANIPEFGTVKKEDEYRALKAMSTYEHIRPGTRYPAVMLVHGVNDIRVPVWQSLKAAARLATASTSGRPVLLRLEYDAGHGQGSSRAQLQQRAVDLWSFALWQMGEPGFQPGR